MVKQLPKPKRLYEMYKKEVPEDEPRARLAVCLCCANVDQGLTIDVKVVPVRRCQVTDCKGFSRWKQREKDVVDRVFHMGEIVVGLREVAKK